MALRLAALLLALTAIPPAAQGADAHLALEFRSERPTEQLLEAAKLCAALARLNVHGRWQTNALSGIALGASAGYYLQRRDNPLVLHLEHRGIYVAIERRF